MNVPAQRSAQHPWINGVVRMVPVVLGYVALGFAFGGGTTVNWQASLRLPTVIRDE